MWGGKYSLKDIREFFWPILEEEGEDNSTNCKTDQLNSDNIKDTDVEDAIDYSLNCYNEERDRARIVENKAMVFIGLTGFIATLNFALTEKLIFMKDLKDNMVIYIFHYLGILVICVYAIKTIFHAVRCMERSEYHSIGCSDILNGQKRELLTKILKCTKDNHPTINRKVDQMVMAQEFFKRMLGALFIYLLIYPLFKFLHVIENGTLFINELFNKTAIPCLFLVIFLLIANNIRLIRK